jgi:hypothetical protein
MIKYVKNIFITNVLDMNSLSTSIYTLSANNNKYTIQTHGTGSCIVSGSLFSSEEDKWVTVVTLHHNDSAVFETGFWYLKFDFPDTLEVRMLEHNP